MDNQCPVCSSFIGDRGDKVNLILKYLFGEVDVSSMTDKCPLCGADVLRNA